MEQVQTRKCPRLYFLPSVLCKEDRTPIELGFDLVQPDPPPKNAITIDAKDEEVHHTPMLVDDLSDALRFQRLDHTTKQGVLADADTSAAKTDIFE